MEKNMDFADIIARNEALKAGESDVLMTHSDLGAFAGLIQLVHTTSYDGDDRNYAAQKIVAMGGVNMARTIVGLSEGMDEQEPVFRVFDIVRDGATAGIIDLAVDYSADIEDTKYFLQLHDFFGEVSGDYLLEDAHDEDLQSLATLFRTRGYDVNMESLVEYVIERGSFSIEGYDEYRKNHAAVREGSL